MSNNTGWNSTSASLPLVLYGGFEGSNNEEILGLILIGPNLKWSVLIGRYIFTARGRHGVIPYYRSTEEILGLILIGREQFHRQGALQVNCVDGYDWSRAVA